MLSYTYSVAHIVVACAIHVDIAPFGEASLLDVQSFLCGGGYGNETSLSVKLILIVKE